MDHFSEEMSDPVPELGPSDWWLLGVDWEVVTTAALTTMAHTSAMPPPTKSHLRNRSTSLAHRPR